MENSAARPERIREQESAVEQEKAHLRPDPEEHKFEESSEKPLSMEELERRFGNRAEAAAEAQLSQNSREEVLTPEEMDRRYGRDANAAADRQLQFARDHNFIDTEAVPDRTDELDSDLETADYELHERIATDIEHNPKTQRAVDRLAELEILAPEKWAAASPKERREALQKASNVLGDIYGYESPMLMFTRFDYGEKDIQNDPENYVNDLQGRWHGPHVYSDGSAPGPSRSSPIELRMDFENPLKCDHPREAVNTLCHEYRHVYRWYKTYDGPPESSDEVLRFRQEYENPPAKDDLDAYRKSMGEHDSRLFANTICNRLYGSNS